jgi:hypothetical protein
VDRFYSYPGNLLINDKYDIFITDFTIKTEKRDIQLTKPCETIQLLSQKALQKHLARNYKYIGLIQVGIKPLTKEGLNTTILAVFRDAITISLKDKNILQSMLLQIKTHNYDMLEGYILVALIFKIHYKACSQPLLANTNSNLKKEKHSFYKQIYPAQTLLSPKAIQWKDISLLEDWILEGAAPQNYLNHLNLMSE